MLCKKRLAIAICSLHMTKISEKLQDFVHVWTVLDLLSGKPRNLLSDLYFRVTLVAR